MTITINYAITEDAQRLLCLHYDTGATFGQSEPHHDIDGYRAGPARRELLKRGYIRPTHGGGYQITPEGQKWVESWRGS